MIQLECNNFNLQQTLECGQVFRYQKISNKEYILLTVSKIAHLIQQNNILLIESNYENENFWIEYFDFNTNYKKIKETLSKDEILKPAILFGSGIHILKQDFQEMLISFIMSQNKQIPQIKQCIELYCEKFGKEIFFQNQKYFTFPKLEILPTLEELRECKVGFRDKYILDALIKIKNGYFDNIETLSEIEQEEKLLSVKGIGAKVCNCIMLFGLYRTDRFPIDVWIKRKMQELYFDGKEINNDVILMKAKELFGEYLSFAQQYLFYSSINKVI